ncbi:hypothetical protein C7271_02025 [filamentous cyanobacterium CCP5]|nr:hypothetical protein C7271_02025 [filamentous cyanobacterium CCP5]
MFSTDTEINLLLYRCCTARFQIKFVFRNTHQPVNASLVALNPTQVALQEDASEPEALRFSLASSK